MSVKFPDVSAARIARALRFSEEAAREILSGEREVTPAMAERIAESTDTNAKDWMRKDK